MEVAPLAAAVEDASVEAAQPVAAIEDDSVEVAAITDAARARGGCSDRRQGVEQAAGSLSPRSDACEEEAASLTRVRRRLGLCCRRASPHKEEPSRPPMTSMETAVFICQLCITNLAIVQFLFISYALQIWKLSVINLAVMQEFGPASKNVINLVIMH
jgi:hypothetical protein